MKAENIQPIKDDLSRYLITHRLRVKIAVVLGILIVVVSCLIAALFFSRVENNVLQSEGAKIVAKQQVIAEKFATWGEEVKNWVDNISDATIVQVYTNSYASMPVEERHDVLKGVIQKSEQDQETLLYLKDLLTSYMEVNNATAAILALASGEVLLASPEEHTLSPAWRSLLQQAQSSGQFTFGTISLQNNTAFLDLAAPVFATAAEKNAAPIGVLLLRVRLDNSFAAVLQAPAEIKSIKGLQFIQFRTEGVTQVRTTIAGLDGTLSLSAQNLRAGTQTSYPTNVLENFNAGKEVDPSFGLYFELTSPLHGYVLVQGDEVVIGTAIEKAKQKVMFTLVAVIVGVCILYILFFMFEDMITQRRFNRRIVQQKFLLDSINNSIRAGLMLISQSGQVLYVNPWLAATIGHEGWVNMPIQKCMGHDVATHLLETVQTTIAADTEGSTEVSIEADDGKHLFRVSLFPCRPSEGGLQGEHQDGCVVMLKDITRFRAKAQQQQQRVQNMLDVFSAVVESVDKGLRGHTERMLAIIDVITARLELTRDEQETLSLSARLFQVGKLFVPRELLNKEGKLTPEELAQVRKAPRAAYDLLRSLDFGLPVAETVYGMNEKVDGRGPRGLKGDEIIRTSRILSVVNAFCSMISPRTYRKAMTVEEALDILAHDSGFDQNVVQAISAIPTKNIEEILRKCLGRTDTSAQAAELWEDLDTKHL